MGSVHTGNLVLPVPTNPSLARLHLLHKRAGSALHWVVQTGKYSLDNQIGLE